MRLFAALLAAAVTFAAPLAFACDCGGLDLDHAMKNADVVFTGRVVDASAQRPGEAEMQVDRVFKGTAGPAVSMAGTGNNCTFSFVKGEQYLVFARKQGSGGKLTTSICTRTAKTSDAQAKKDLAELKAH